MLKKLLEPLSSLTLTVALLILSLLLVYAGTWAQVDSGIWQVQAKYFHSFFTWVDFQTFFPRPATGQPGIPGGFPMPGGYTLGLLLLINLIAAHALRFKPKLADLALIPQFAVAIWALHAWEKTPSTWLITLSSILAVTFTATLLYFHAKRAGVILIHLGLILLIVGEGITSGAALETQMAIEEGKTVNYAQDIREAELAVIDPSPADKDHVTVVRETLLKPGVDVKHPNLPFDLHIDRYYQNSDIVAAKPGDLSVTDQFGTWTVTEKPRASGATDAEKVDLPSAFVTVSKAGRPVANVLVSALKNHTQPVEIDGKTYQLALRFRRHYKDYAVTLLDFRHDKYTGTEIPKNYSSQVILNDPVNNERREVLIRMNEPMRYRGETFYQASFIGATTTVLQVVRNPAWTLPYIACVLGSLGLLIHFSYTLANFLRKRALAPKPTTFASFPQPKSKNQKSKSRDAGEYTLNPQPFWTRGSVLFPTLLTALCAIYVIGHIKARPSTLPYDLDAFGRIPVSYEGRVQPLDSVARNAMKLMLGRESTYTADGQKIPAIQWLLDLWADPKVAETYTVFRIDYPDVLTLLDLKPKPKSGFAAVTGIGGATPYRFSVDEMRAHLNKLDAELNKLNPQDEKNFSLYQRKLSELGRKFNLFMRLSNFEGAAPPMAPQARSGLLHFVPPADGAQQSDDWQTISTVVQQNNITSIEQLPPRIRDLFAILRAYNGKNYAEFNAKVASYNTSLAAERPGDVSRVKFEQFFNRFDPFTNSLVLYILAFLLVCFSWMGWTAPFKRAAYWILLLSFVVHTFGLIGRTYISGRPPVTNLASSAIFIAWGVVALAAAMELVYRNGVSTAASAVTGFLSLLIAYKLSIKDGDTMKVLQAVLDTNFWLATHVIVITLGYAATFLAGFLAIGYVLFGTLTPWLTADARKSLTRMIYGVTCFAILFSFVGTVLGGIWADQSWGRFWGWDPKENGAVMIVLANALLLHARWGGLARERGIAILAIVGNIITAWSWFGTNMLGVGLHSYGFMESALHWLLFFVGTQLFLIALANLPLSWWQSYRAERDVLPATPTKTPKAAAGTA